MITLNLSIWSKSVSIYTINGTITEEVKTELNRFQTLILEILKVYHIIDAKYLSTNFGLDEGIGRNLLHQMASEYPTLLQEDKDHKLHSRFPKDYNPEQTVILQPITKSQFYSICLKPIFFIQNPVYRYNSELKEDPIDEIYSALMKIKRDLKEKQQQNPFLIPSHITEINLEKGIEILGWNTFRIQADQKKFQLMYEKKSIAQIPQSHPIYTELYNEILEIYKNAVLNIRKIQQRIRKEAFDINFNLNVHLETGQIDITINEKDIEKVGKIFHFYLSFNSQIKEIELDGDWNLKTQFIIDIPDDRIKKWIFFFERLNKFDTKQIRATLEKGCLDLSSIQDIWLQIPFLHVPFNKDIFAQNVESICHYNSGLWFNYLLARLKEDEIFVK